MIRALCFLLTISSLFAAFNERHYEGICSLWKSFETVDKRLEIIRAILPDNPTVFEAGAFNGTESVQFATLWPKGKILSFEPNPAQFAKYQERAVHFSNMYGYNLAVNTYNGVTKFFLCWGTNGVDPVFEGASSLLPASESMKIHYMGPIIAVPCVIFDDWCAENDVSTVDFMWLDLEGFELSFLKSSPQILKTVKVIYTETNFYRFREGTAQYADLKSFLESNGFILIAHWYNEGLQGDAIFVRTL